MKNFVLVTLSFISVIACADPSSDQSKELRKATLDNQQLRLVDEKGRCTVIHSALPPLRLDMQWPCNFSEDLKNEVRIEKFGNAQIVMVERSEPLPPPSELCSTELQAVRLFRGKLEASPISRVGACLPRHWDQKNFVWRFDWRTL